jgi:cysteine desulfurase
MSDKIYLDYAAATPMDPEVVKAMQPYWLDNSFNPSATYLSARHVRQEHAESRQKIAGLLGAQAAEIIFTAGATEANNLAIQGVMDQYPKAELLVSAIEHESVLEPARRYKHQEIPVNEQGLILLNKLSNLINDKTVLVSVMLVNNELGTIQPLKEIANIVSHVRRARKAQPKSLPIYLHTDAAQAGNYLDLHVSRLGVDLMVINGGKLYGPKQSGILFIKAGTQLKPLIVGGGQEFGMRSGTENVAAAAGMAKALELAQKNHVMESKRVGDLRKMFEAGLREAMPAATVNGSKHHRAAHLSSVTFPGHDNERLMMEIDEAGIMCAVGSACSASREEASHVLSAIGLSHGQSRATLRFSLGKFTTQAHIQKTLMELARLTAINR